MFCYKLTNKITGKSYIGITTKPVCYRKSTHKTVLTQTYLSRAIKKYGWENFMFEILYEATSLKELLKLEPALISAHNTYAPNGYNLTFGGEGLFGFKHSLESKIKMSSAKIGSKNAAKLTTRQVRKIKLANLLGISKYELAEMYNVSKGAIHNLTKQRTWPEVTLYLVKGSS